jgi:hypothetical protein
MAGLCTVCIFTRRGEVDALLIRGRSYRELERKYGLARSSLSRHKRDHLRAEIAKAESQRVEDIHQRFRDLEGHARRLLKKAEQARDYGAAISALREVARLIALAEPPPPPPDPSTQRVSLTFKAAGPSTRVLPAAEKIIDVETVVPRARRFARSREEPLISLSEALRSS